MSGVCPTDPLGSTSVWVPAGGVTQVLKVYECPNTSNMGVLSDQVNDEEPESDIGFDPRVSEFFLYCTWVDISSTLGPP